MEEADYREASREQWSSSASSWARAAEEEEKGASAETARWMLAAAALEPGERVLELACGAGRVGLQAAERVGPEGTVLCSDFSPAMVEAVAERVRRLELSNVTARALDAERLELDEEPFDAVLCRFGFMLMADPSQALRESARVLRPGGRLVLAVWGEGEANRWLSIILEEVMRHLDAPAPEPGAPGPWALADPQRLGDLIAQAGLSDPEVRVIDTQQEYDSAAAWWDKILEVSGPLQAMLGNLPEERREAIRAAVLARGQEFVTAAGDAVFPAASVGARALKPG
jgi:SAM-dependent methyltransferase